MKKLMIIGFFWLCSMHVQAQIQVQVDSTQVSQDESFRLILTQSNLQRGSGAPDLTPLQKDFFILGTEQSINYSNINGQTQSTNSWIIALKAKKNGTLTIPSIKIGTEQSAPIDLTVNASAAPLNTNNQTKENQQAIILTGEVNNQKPYVNQEIIYKVTLLNSKRLLDANYQAPKIENALLIPLETGKHYQIQKNNVPYLVEEQNYAIFPQKSGPLKITSPVFTALVYDFDPQRIQAKSKPITLDVQPIPPDYKGKIWLPAKEVTLSENYESGGQTINQGSTMVRTVTVYGVGIPAQLLPTINFAEKDSFQVYPEKGKEKNKVVQGEIKSSATIKVTYLFNKSGTITIPELKLPWFNTQTGKEEIATLAPKTIEVTPNAPASAANINPPEPPAQATTPQLSSYSLNQYRTTNTLPWIVATLFGLAWLLTLIAWKCQKRNPTTPKRAYSKSLNAVRIACQQGNAPSARDALLKWGHLYWPDAPLLNLTDIMRLTTDVSFRKQVHILSQVLYKNTGQITWRGDELWHCLQKIKQTPSTPQKNSDLPPINRI